MALTATTPDGIDVVYEVTGEGPALLLVHGITESRRMWDPLVAHLASDHRVVTVDLPGHGQSGSAPDYSIPTLVRGAAAAAAAAAVTDGAGGLPLAIGHSLGGVVVTGLAATPGGCRGAINIDQTLELGGLQAGLRQLEPALRGDEATFLATLTAMFDAMAGPLDEVEKTRLASIRRPRQDVVLDIWTPLLDGTPDELEILIRQVVSGIAVPYLSLHGDDPGPEYSTWLRQLIPTATIEVWPGLAHYPHLIEQERFVQRVRDFERSLP